MEEIARLMAETFRAATLVQKITHCRTCRAVVGWDGCACGLCADCCAEHCAPRVALDEHGNPVETSRCGNCA